MKKLSSFSPGHPGQESRQWRWVAPLLLGLLLLAHASRAQTTLYNAPGNTLYQNGDLYNTGTVENAGTYTPASGTLLVAGGDFLNSGTISSSPAAATLLLREANAGTAHLLTLGGQALPNITLDVPAGTTLGSGGSVTGVLTLTTGHLLTSATTGTDYTLILGSAAALAGETNAHYVQGRVAQARNLSGSVPVDFGNMGFTLNPTSSSFPLTVERRAGLLRAGVSYGQNPGVPAFQGIDRVWALSSTTGTVPASNATLTWLSADDHGLSFAGTTAQVWRSDNGGTSWVKQGAVQDGSARSVAVDITRLNALYTVSSTAAPLPVELVVFTATKAGPDGLLSWKTASERNSAYVEVQASANGTTWLALGQREAAGTSSAPRSYQFLDKTLARYGTPVVYYRLRLVDRDGTAAYSPVVSLAPDAAVLAFGLSAWPNPFVAGPLAVELVTPLAGDLSLVVYDAVGRLVLQRDVRALPAGTQALRLDEVSTLPAGSYTLVARQGGQRAAVHLVRQ